MDELDPDLKPRKPSVHAVDVVSTTTASATGVETVTQSHMDYSALGGGALCVLCALIGVALIGRMGSRPVRFAVFALLLALGGFQIIRGVLADTGGTSVEGVMF